MKNPSEDTIKSIYALFLEYQFRAESTIAILNGKSIYQVIKTMINELMKNILCEVEDDKKYIEINNICNDILNINIIKSLKENHKETCEAISHLEELGQQLSKIRKNARIKSISEDWMEKIKNIKKTILDIDLIEEKYISKMSDDIIKRDIDIGKIATGETYIGKISNLKTRSILKK